MSGELVVFLQARLDEDEALATAAADPDGDGDWRYEDQARPVPRIVGTTWESSLTDGVWDCDDPCDSCVDLRQPSRNAGLHIARHDPARVLREVAAKRAILARHGDQHDCGHPASWEYPYAGCPDVRHLAAVYCDHPDYRQEWKP